MNGGATERELGQAGSQPVCLFVKSAISASTQPVDIVSGLAMRIKDRKKTRQSVSRLHNYKSVVVVEDGPTVPN